MRIILAFFLLTVISLLATGYATTTSGEERGSDNSASVGPEYYQSNDNPFHSD